MNTPNIHAFNIEFAPGTFRRLIVDPLYTKSGSTTFYEKIIYHESTKIIKHDKIVSFISCFHHFVLS